MFLEEIYIHCLNLFEISESAWKKRQDLLPSHRGAKGASFVYFFDSVLDDLIIKQMYTGSCQVHCRNSKSKQFGLPLRLFRHKIACWLPCLLFQTLLPPTSVDVSQVKIRWPPQACPCIRRRYDIQWHIILASLIVIILERYLTSWVAFSSQATFLRSEE